MSLQIFLGPNFIKDQHLTDLQYRDKFYLAFQSQSQDFLIEPTPNTPNCGLWYCKVKMAKIGVCLFWKSVSMLSFCLGRSSKVCKEQSRSLGLRKGENFFCPDFPPSCKESSLIRCRMNRKRQQFLHTGIFHHCNKYRQCSHSGPPITCPWETWTGPHSVHSK